MIFKNKKADEKILSPYNIVIWIMVIIGISWGAVLFYGFTLDIKFEEARILNFKVIDCLIDGSSINPVFTKSDFDVLEECRIDKSAFASGAFYINATLIDKATNKTVKTAETGNPDLKIQCELKSSEKHFAECFPDSIEVLYTDNSGVIKQGILKVFTASNNAGAKL